MPPRLSDDDDDDVPPAGSNLVARETELLISFVGPPDALMIRARTRLLSASVQLK